MPLMREWVEIHVDEDLIVDVVRELLALAADPNHVEITYGTAGRVILAEVHLADIWYQMRVAKEDNGNKEEVDKEVGEVPDTQVHASGFEVIATAKVEPSTSVATTVPTPAKRVQVTQPSRTAPMLPTRPAVKPSASPNGEDS